MTDPITLSRSPSDWAPTTRRIESSATTIPVVPVVGSRPLRQTVTIINIGPSTVYVSPVLKPGNDEVAPIYVGAFLSMDTEGGVFASMTALSDATTIVVIETYSQLTGGGSGQHVAPLPVGSA